MVISIHAPREGSDQLKATVQRPCSIFLSTLPARGATSSGLLQPGQTLHFYPRSPRGERLKIPDLKVHKRIFLSTLPARGATPSKPCYGQQQDNFYPRSPRGERPAKQPVGIRQHNISIHAPREGSDLGAKPGALYLVIFLSTLPARGATRALRGAASVCKISIHAPREGSDGDSV